LHEPSYETRNPLGLVGFAEDSPTLYNIHRNALLVKILRTEINFRLKLGEGTAYLFGMSA